jgi:polysaccharide deacetylase 2 family uncharacterized protein YibQ
VTLGFSPYAARLPAWTEEARAQGHEVILGVPMEPIEYSRHDPGPYGLLTTLDVAQNLDRLDWVMSRATGYVGLTNYMGSRFTASADELKPVLEAVKAHGLLFLDSRATSQSKIPAIAAEIGLPRAVTDRVIDAEANNAAPTRAIIDRRLGELEEIARRNGHAVGMGFAYPVTAERVAQWAGSLADKGLVLAPLSAVTVTGDRKEKAE